MSHSENKPRTPVSPPSCQPFRVCANHGLPFYNEPFGFPLHVKLNGTMVMSHLAFCRLECVKTYVAANHPNLLDLFEQYSRNHHGVSFVPVLPAPSCLSHFHVDPSKGISVEEYFSSEVVVSGSACVTRNSEFAGLVSQTVSEDVPLQMARWETVFQEHKERENNSVELSSTLFKLDHSAQKGLIDVEGFSITEISRQKPDKSETSKNTLPPEAEVMDFVIDN